MKDGLFTPASPVPTDPAAINLASALKRIAIGRAQRSTEGSHGCISEHLSTGTLVCIAELALDRQGEPMMWQDQPLYHTRFEYHGKRISLCEAEQVLTGQPIEVAA